MKKLLAWLMPIVACAFILFMASSTVAWYNPVTTSQISDWPSGLTVTELGYVNGVTSAIQTQFSNKQTLNANLTLLGNMAPAGMTNYIVGVGAGGIYELKNDLAVHEVNLVAVTDYQVGAVQLGQVAETLKNKTLSTGVKLPGSALLTHPTVFAAGVVQQTTVTSRLYGQAKFDDATDKATNYIEYKWRVPDDYDNTVDPIGTFSFALGAADISPQVYAISVATIPASSVYDTAPSHEVEMVYAGDAAGADKDMEYTNAATLTDWHDDLVAGQTCWVRVARDGDHATDTSIVDSYSMELNIKYGRVLP